MEKRTGKWIARIKIAGQRAHLGTFSKKEDASAAYAAANLQHFGEFGGSTI